MNDGTTAAFSPVQESDMLKVKEIFQSALNAIMAATELSKVVEGMKSDVSQLRQDIEQTQARNIELDRMLADTRRQRDEAEQGFAQAKQALDTANNGLAIANHANDGLKSELSVANSRLSEARSDRDQALHEAIATSEALHLANAKLAEIHKSMGVSFTPFEVAKPVPLIDPPQDYVDPHQAEEPTPYRIYEGEPDFNWDKPRHWDFNRRLNYNEA